MRTARAAACFAALAILLSLSTQTQAAGALATGRCGAFGYAFDDLSPEAAALRARAQCKGQECKVVSSLRHACAAFALDATDVCGPHAWANAPTADRARNVASQTCQRYGGRNCIIRAWLCDAKG
jgi:hypothetical protein